ncbi:MAG: LuxR C-terminal-related transcriptional regulator [Chloroflexota bacterium]
MPETAVSTFFLRTKLYRPSLPEDHIIRPHLLAKLGNCANRPLTLVVAPAGYGKSTLVSAWIKQEPCLSAWISLDKRDDDLAVFLTYFVAAIQSVLPDVGARAASFAAAASLPPLPTIITYFLNELDKLERDFVLVLDDFHVLTNPDIYKLLDDLLGYSLPRFHLVLVSRTEPPLHITKLRAQDKVTELHGVELRFSPEEVASFARQTLPNMADAETVRILTEKTEGWPVGLRLATIAIRRWGIDDHRPAVLLVENQYVIAYLVNEVLGRQSPVVTDYLLKFSILDRFCAPLCAAVVGAESFGQEILPQLERAGLMVESLDGHNTWYRFHQLFREALRQRLEENYAAAEVAALHRRAGAWLAAQGLVEDAIDQALAAGDAAAAVDILSEKGVTLIDKESWLLLERLLNKFTPEAIDHEPKLLLLLAWLHLARWQLRHVEAIRARLVEHSGTVRQTADEVRFMECSLHVFAAIGYSWTDKFEEGVFHARAALAETRPEWGTVRAYAWIHLGVLTHYLSGGAESLTALAKEDHWVEFESVLVRKQVAVGFVDWLCGDLGKLLQTAKHGFELTHGLPGFSASLLHYFAGSVCYERNDLDTAASHFSAILEQRYITQPVAFVLGAVGQALIYQAKNMTHEARRMAETAVQYCLEMELPALLLTARAFQAELALRQGQLDTASYWATQINGAALTKTMPFFYQAQLTLPKVWLAEKSPASLRQAEAELLRLHDIVTTTHNTPCQIKVLAMQSLLYQTQKKAQLAQEALTHAVRLAQPGGFIRLFVDLGPQMAVLLKQLHAQGAATVYLQQILQAFPAVKPAAAVDPLTLVESLTDRETEVLGLLAQRLSNNEIAAMMFISPATVKRHTSNIYQKLGAKNRREAVARAAALNLLADQT